MFDVGFSELFVIAIVALLVLGPERLPKAARFTGLWVRRARAQWYSVKSELENELADDELKRHLLQTRDQLQGEMRDLRNGLQHGAQAVRGEFETAQHAAAATANPPDAGDEGEGTPDPSSPDRGAAAGSAPFETAPVVTRPAGSTPVERTPVDNTPADESTPAQITSSKRPPVDDPHDRR